MLKEYALDPACLREWQTFRYFIENFGVPHGRLIAEFPSKWLKMAYASCDSFSFQQKQKLEIELKRIKGQGFRKTSRLYDGSLDWFENALEQHKDEPFHAIISVKSDAENKVIDAAEITESDSLWEVSRSKVIPRNAFEMAATVSMLLSTSKQILLIDPHFGPEVSRYRRTFQAFLRSAVENRSIDVPFVEVHTQVKSTEEFFREECCKQLTALIPAGMTVRFVRWTERQGGQHFHNRYILTNRGGAAFLHGLDEGRDGESDDVFLLDQENYQQRWSEYVGDNPAFDLVEEPFVVQGAAI